MSIISYEKLNPDRPVYREQVNKIEALMKQMPQVEIPVTHHFSLGLYARTIYIPAGATVVGKLHKYPQLNILAKGKLLVSVDDGINLLEAVKIISSPAGTKRIAHAVEDSIWITVHSTDETDLDKIEEHFIAQSEEEYLEFIQANQLTLPLEA